MFNFDKRIAVFQLLYPLIHPIEPFLVPFCFFLAWALMFLLAGNLWSAFNHSVTRAKRMHQIPCPGCQFFTNDYRLKCTVHPHIANSEDAIECPDYCPKTYTLY
ncbi:MULTISPECIES: hypothetical protein [Aerosakkonema]|uniref:hypothetical protein n=1 Tax=Aerosakkonema TaxID=1246629 RepID=UPI0035B7AFF0